VGERRGFVQMDSREAMAWRCGERILEGSGGIEVSRMTLVAGGARRELDATEGRDTGGSLLATGSASRNTRRRRPSAAR
jgi:hypothetical protein